MTTVMNSVTQTESGSEVAATESAIVLATLRLGHKFAMGEITADDLARQISELTSTVPTEENSHVSASPDDASVQSQPVAASSEVTAKRPEKFKRRNPDLTLAEYIIQYRQEYKGRDPSRLSQLDFWEEKLGSTLLVDLDDDEIAHILDDLASEHGRAWRGTDADGCAIFKKRPTKRSPATINRYLATISAICTFAIKTRACPKDWFNPCSRISSRTENNHIIRYLSQTEQSALLKAARDSKWERLYLLVLMALKTGARRSELLNLRWKDIHWDQKVAHLKQTKNGEERMLILLDDVIKELRLHEDKADKLIFPSTRTPSQPMAFNVRWEEALKVAGIKNFRFHDLRHTTASLLVQNGVSLFEVGAILGHKDSETTKRYAHLATDQSAKNLRRVFG
jgi:integrase